MSLNFLVPKDQPPAGGGRFRLAKEGRVGGSNGEEKGRGKDGA